MSTRVGVSGKRVGVSGTRVGVSGSLVGVFDTGVGVSGRLVGVSGAGVGVSGTAVGAAATGIGVGVTQPADDAFATGAVKAAGDPQATRCHDTTTQIPCLVHLATGVEAPRASPEARRFTLSAVQVPTRQPRCKNEIVAIVICEGGAH